MSAHPHVTLRDFDASDAPASYGVFYAAVRQGAQAHYTMRQRVQWASSSSMPGNWAAKRTSQITRVAVTAGRLVGFFSMERDGYLDMAFVHPSVMGTGVADQLYLDIERIAVAREIPKMTVLASHLARSFLRRHGWSQIAARKTFRNGEEIANFEMTKTLSSD